MRLTVEGTYKPQQHVYHLPSLSLKYARHTSSLNVTFLLLSTDYSKSIHLQNDRSLEFHTPMGCHHTVRIPRYGRGLAYQPLRTELVVPAEGREIYRFDLEAGRFLKPFEAHDSVNCVESVAHADKSHGLLAFGTDMGTVEFFDPRSRTRVGILGMPPSSYIEDPMTQERRAGRVTCLQFHPAGLTLAAGTEAGIISLYDIRSPNPLLVKDQGYGFAIQKLEFLSSNASGFAAEPRVLSADKRIIKIWDQNTGAAWTSTEPPVDINDVAVIPNTGMIFTANEGPDMHTFFIPSLGPAPKWCSFLDSITEEMAESHLNDPDSYAAKVNTDTGSAYDNFKFVTKSELEKLNLDNLIGKTKKDGTPSVLRPYMHGYFIDQKLYEEARLIADPFEWERERRNMVRKKIEKERESRIRSTKAELKVRVNKKYAEKLAAKEERANAKGKKDTAGDVLMDDRFKAVFENPEFEIDENTMEFKQLNPSTFVEGTGERKGRTAAESEEDRSSDDSSDSDSGSDSDSSKPSPPPTRRPKANPESLRLSTSNFSKSGKFPNKNNKLNTDRTFSSRLKGQHASGRQSKSTIREVGGEREMSFFPASRKKNGGNDAGKDMGRQRPRGKEDRRSASGNVMRSMGR